MELIKEKAVWSSFPTPLELMETASPAEASKDMTEAPSPDDEKRRNYGGVYVGLPADLTAVAASQSKATRKGHKPPPSSGCEDKGADRKIRGCVRSKMLVWFPPSPAPACTEGL
ncbi:hypothetical protein JZ751_016770, partial [Albula glossodonta]